MLGENLKTLRKQRGMSQEVMAQQLNIVRQTVSKWEQGLSVIWDSVQVAIWDYILAGWLLLHCMI